MNYNQLMKLLDELQEGMTPEALSKLTPEQMCYVIDQIATIKGQLAVLKSKRENKED